MSGQNEAVIERLVRGALGDQAAGTAFATLSIDEALLAETGPSVSRAAFAMALNVVLFDDLLRRVPSGAAYVAGRRAEGRRIFFDHGALRTILFADGPTGALPAGTLAFARILEPLGYAVADLYPLPALRMTGSAFRHRDHPATIPQFFVSELHVAQFGAPFADAARRVFGASRDPLSDESKAVLADFAGDADVHFERAAAALSNVAAAFGPQHDPARIDDYETLLAQSAEAAWIATEGNSFNHATDRVSDVEALALQLRGEGRPIKERVEISASGRVRQTALRADSVERAFAAADGTTVKRAVPGSFYEFISRHIDEDTGTLDLRFDSGNATGIFAMTKTA